MKYLSVCSGVGTDHVAWAGLGFECVGFAEIEPFPSAILAHHFPSIPNFGDFTRVELEMLDGKPDVLVGGTPCQSFSVAGQRAGLDDPRGNLTLEFARLARRLGVTWIVWENVPGVLSSGDFGAIISTFQDCGYSVCWRVLDAQHFGVPQRRRRVFVVGYLGDDWRPSAEVLLEQASVRGNPQEGSTKGQEVAGTLGGGSGSRDWSSDLDRATFIPVEIDALRVSAAVSSKWAKGSGGPAGDEAYNLVHGYVPEQLPMPFDLAQITSKLNYSQARPGDMVPPLNTVSQMHVALAVKTAQTSSNGIGVAEDVAYTLDGAQGQAIALSAAESTEHPQTYFVNVIHQNKANSLSVLDYSPSLRSGASHNSHLALVSTVVRRLTPRECERLQGLPDDWTLVPWRGKPAPDGPRYKAIGNGMAVPVVKWIGQRLRAIQSIAGTRRF